MSEASYSGRDAAPAPGGGAEPTWSPPFRVICDSREFGAALAGDLAPGGAASPLEGAIALSGIKDARGAAEFAFAFGVADVSRLARKRALRVGALIAVVEHDHPFMLSAVKTLAERLGAEVLTVRDARDPAELARWFEYLVAAVLQHGSLSAAVRAAGSTDAYAQVLRERADSRDAFGPAPWSNPSDHWREASMSDDAFIREEAPPEMAGDLPESTDDLPDSAESVADPAEDAPAGGDDTGREEAPPDARVLEAAVGGERGPAPKAFRAGASFDLDIWIGDGRGHGIRARTPTGDLAAIDDENLAEGAAAEIAVWTTGGAMRREGVRIRPDRTSTKASFEVEVPEGIQDFSLNVALILRGRVAQSGVIRGPVTPTGRPSRRQGAGAVEFLVGPGLADLGRAGDGESAGALTLIEDGSGVYEFAPPAGDGAEALFERPISGIELDRFTAHLGAAIDLLVDMQSDASKPDWFASKRGARAFSELARIGHDAFLALVESFANTDPARLAAIVDSPLVHLATFEATEGSVALELLYDRLQPDENAPWCAGFDEALETGRCPSCAAWSPDAVFDDPVPVCPAGFWGVRKRIERVPHRTETAEEASISNHSIARGDAIAGLDNLCVGVSDRVDGAAVGTGSAKATDRMLELIADALGEPPALVREWKQWEREVRARSPQLLVLLTHTEQQRLELGAADLVERARITNGYVRTPFSSAAPGPIVLLLGCDTATTTGLHSFVQTFRNRGASIVVGTIGTTLGRFAAPIAGELVAQLNRPEGSESVGATLTALRRSTLRRGWVTGLLVTAFSDASHPISRKD